MSDGLGSRCAKAAKMIAMAGSIALLASCGGAGLSTMSVSQANSELTNGYQIDAGDQLKVTVFEEESLTGEYEVGTGGTLALPLIDALAVRNKQPAEVAQMIETTLLQGGYVLDPRVSVEILEHRSFFILGEVAEPGEYSHNGELTLEQAVAKAGGFSPRANKSQIVLKRQTWDEGRVIKLDRGALQIAPGDTITVRESFF